MTYEEFQNEQDNKQIPFPEIQAKFENMVQTIDEVAEFYLTNFNKTIHVYEIYEKFENGETSFGQYENSLRERLSALREFEEGYPVHEFPQPTKELLTEKELDEYICNRKIEFEKSIYYTELWICQSLLFHFVTQTKNDFKQKLKEEELQKLNSAIDSLKQQIKQKENQKAGWIQYLIANGYIQSDGKTTIKSLNEIARGIRIFTGSKVTKSQLERFINRKTRKAYPPKTLENACTEGNSSYDKSLNPFKSL